MPRYYFDTAENRNERRDEEGTVLADDKSARDEAIRALPGLAAEELPDGPQHSFWVRVRDERGEYIFEASLDLKTHWLSAHK
jgi:NADPH-dependent ferric siderophore reductase